MKILHTHLPMKMVQTECSETSAYKIQTPGNCPEENIQHSEKGENLKSRKYNFDNIDMNGMNVKKFLHVSAFNPNV